MSEQTTNRRKTLIVNPQKQKRIVLNVTLIPAITLAAMMVLIAYFHNALEAEASKSNVLLEGLTPLFLATAGLVMISGVFVVTNALVLSHKIAGPAYRVRTTIERMREGDLSMAPINLRDGDYLDKVTDELNLLLEALNDNPPPGFRTRASKHEDLVKSGVVKAAETVEEPELVGATED